MKSIHMSDLNVGDIFAHEIKLHNRVAFEVTKINDGTIECLDRKTRKATKKQKKGNVILLRKHGD
jgi:hypothetical protein